MPVIISAIHFFVIKQQSNFHLFQAVCIIVAFLSWLLMRYTGMNVQVAVEASTTGNTQNQGSIEIYIKHFIFYKVPIINNKVYHAYGIYSNQVYWRLNELEGGRCKNRQKHFCFIKGYKCIFSISHPKAFECEEKLFQAFVLKIDTFIGQHNITLSNISAIKMRRWIFDTRTCWLYKSCV